MGTLVRAWRKIHVVKSGFSLFMQRAFECLLLAAVYLSPLKSGRDNGATAHGGAKYRSWLGLARVACQFSSEPPPVNVGGHQVVQKEPRMTVDSTSPLGLGQELLVIPH